MSVIVALTTGLVIWIIGWALGAKPVDAFLLTVLIVLPAGAWYIFGPGIKRLLGSGEPPSSSY
ncbi:MAG: hypothetical protein ACJ76Z_12130 [Thermoleophilaceae bacterium]